MSMPSPFFIQNRNCYTAAEPIQRGMPVKLTPDGKQVTNTTGPDDALIGISTCDYHTGGIVEIVWIGFTDVSVYPAKAGDEIRLGPTGSPMVGGTGKFIGIAGGDSVGGYAVTRLGLLGYLPAAGGGGGGSEPIPITILDTDQETFLIPEAAWKHSVIVMPNENHPTNEIQAIIINVPAEVAEPGYQFTQFFMVSGQVPSSGFLTLGFNDAFPMYVPEQIPFDINEGVAAFEVLWTYIDTNFQGMPLQGWMPSVTISSVGASGGGLTPPPSTYVPMQTIYIDDQVGTSYELYEGIYTAPASYRIEVDPGSTPLEEVNFHCAELDSIDDANQVVSTIEIHQPLGSGGSSTGFVTLHIAGGGYAANPHSVQLPQYSSPDTPGYDTKASATIVRTKIGNQWEFRVFPRNPLPLPTNVQTYPPRPEYLSMGDNTVTINLPGDVTLSGGDNSITVYLEAPLSWPADEPPVGYQYTQMITRPQGMNNQVGQMSFQVTYPVVWDYTATPVVHGYSQHAMVRWTKNSPTEWSVTVIDLETRYKPVAPGHWIGGNSILSVAEALNQLAQRLHALEYP